MNGFDRLAPVYDRLANFVFGKSMVEAQTAFLHSIERGNHVLILGGGTGWILVELLKTQPDCEIWYVESSMRMIEMARRKCNNHTRVHFILGTQDAIPPMPFDVVIMNFFLDLFSENHLVELAEQIRGVTKHEGIWIVTDFENEGKWWQHILLLFMIRFFRIVCNIEARVLPDIKTILTGGFVREEEAFSFFRGFIKSRLYRVNQPFDLLVPQALYIQMRLKQSM